MRVCVLSCFSRVQLLATCGLSPPFFSIPGDSSGRLLEWVTMPFSRGLPDKGSNPCLLGLGTGRFFTTSAA